MKNYARIFIIFLFISFISAQTYVPDDNFEQALIDLGYDDVLDDYVITDSINTVTTLDVSNDSISDLTGIEGFTALTNLNCSRNQLTSLNMSSNTALTEMNCARNDLTSLDVSSNTALTELICHSNELDSLDVSNNTSLTNLNCAINDLTSLDVISNTALTELICHGNQLTSLDVSSNTALTNLRCYSNNLTSLDVSNNTTLSYLNCGGNSLTSLDVSNNTTLIKLFCNDNQLASLDVSSNTTLTELYCYTNQLDSLDVSSNTALTKLICGNNSLTSLDFSNNIDLTELHFGVNQLTSLDLSSNTALSRLTCNGNDLTSLDVSSNTALTRLTCNSNQLTYLNMKNGVTDGLTHFNATNNDSLECIETLDTTYATENWTYANGNIDEGVTFAADCIPFIGPVWYVSTTGSDETGDGTEENPFATIQTGINAAVNGDTVLVAAGTYVENIYINQDISIISISGEDSTIIDGNQSGSVLTINGDSLEIVLSGFTISNGNGANAGGIYISSNNHNIYLSDLLVDNNISDCDYYCSGNGGGISIYGNQGVSLLEKVVVSNNISRGEMGYVGFGGGIYIGDQLITSLKKVSIINNSQTSYGDDSGGGGLYVGYETDITMEDCIISNNSTYESSNDDGYGGGIYVFSSYNIIMNNVIIEYNNSYSSGGGFAWSTNGWSNEAPFDSIKMTNVVFRGNYSGDNGGGIYIYGGRVIAHLDSVSIISNSVGNEGAGLHVEGSFADNLEHRPIIIGNEILISNNIATFRYGGGINVNNSKFYLNATSIVDNSISLEDDPVIRGGAITVRGDYLFEIENSIVWGNSNPAIYHYNVTADSLNVNYSNIQDGWEGEGNIDANPLFCNADSSDYTLAENSPCVGSGENNANMGALDVGCGPYNFSPTDFSLIEPSNDSEIMIDASNVDNGSITFSWEESIDENDDLLMYLMRATSNEIGNHDIDTSATSFSVSYADMIEDMTENNATVATIEWTVHVTDGIDTVEANNAPFTITIDGGWAMNASAEALIPEVFALHQNYPNPFNPTTSLRYDLPENSLVNITIYDMMGREVKTLVNQTQDAGYKSVVWNATNDYGRPVSAGIYLYQIQAGKYISTKKMALLK